MAMRWLDRDYLNGALPDAEADARLEAWRDARSAVSRAEKNVVSALTDAIYLGDAVVDAFGPIVQDTVDLVLVCGDLQRGYERIWLRYTKAVVIEDEEATLLECLQPGAEIVVDEMHVLTAGQYEQSFILGGRGAFSIQFLHVELRSTVVAPDIRSRLIRVRHGG